MSINVHFKSLKGKRESNEDEHVVFLNADGKNANYATVNLYCVFDGHGGKFVSSYLKRKLPTKLVNKDLTYPLSRKYINQIYDDIQKRLATKYKKQATHCGSTCLVMIHYFKKGKKFIQVLNTGDSRAVMCRSGTGLPLTEDHKPGWYNERKRIEKIIKRIGGASIKFDGVDHRIKDLSVSRAFGDIDATPYVTHRPQVYAYKLSSKGKDTFMILGCDGLWDVLSNQDVVNYVTDKIYVDDKNRIKCKDKRINIANHLGIHAIESGSGDNITNILILLQ